MNTKPFIEFRGGDTGAFTGMPGEHYHQEAYGFSRSMAQDIVFKSPAHMRWAMDHPEPPSKAMEMGTLVHLASLELEKVREAYHLRPETYPSKEGDKPWHGGSNWCKQWLADHSDKPCITVEERDLLWGCYDALHKHPMVHALLGCGEPEVSVFADIDGVQCRCRPDLIAHDHAGQRWVMDLKKCQDASLSGFMRHARSMRYDFQESFYRRVLKAADIQVDHFIFVGVEEQPPHGVAVFEMSPQVIEAQAPNVQRAIDLYRQCREEGKWPGYIEQTQILDWRIYA